MLTGTFICEKTLWLRDKSILSERIWVALGSSQKHQVGKPFHSVLSLSLSFVPPGCCLPVPLPSFLSLFLLPFLLPLLFPSFFFYIDRVSSRQRSLEGHPCLHLCWSKWFLWSSDQDAHSPGEWAPGKQWIIWLPNIYFPSLTVKFAEET